MPGKQIAAHIVFAVYAGDVANVRIDILHLAVRVGDQHRIRALRDGARWLASWSSASMTRLCS